MTRSGSALPYSARAVCPSAATRTPNPSAASRSRTASAMVASSSTTRMRRCSVTFESLGAGRADGTPQSVHIRCRLGRVDTAGYLRRLGLVQAPPSAAALRALHAAHVERVAYETLQIWLDRSTVVGRSSQICRVS